MSDEQPSFGLWSILEEKKAKEREKYIKSYVLACCIVGVGIVVPVMAGFVTNVLLDL